MSHRRAFVLLALAFALPLSGCLKMQRAGMPMASVEGLAMAPPPPGNTESYALIEEQPFLAANSNPLSTFAVDVDRASYAVVRRHLLSGELPPKDAVRLEEMVNYFPYAYVDPEGTDPVGFRLESAAAPWAPDHRLVRVTLQARRADPQDLPPSTLIFLVDVSGSMNEPDKLPLLKAALRLLVDQLRSEDQVAMVVYAGSSGLVLRPTPGNDKARILDALDRLEAGGSTAGGAGLQLAYATAEQARRTGDNVRVVLATDGDFNVGPSSDAEMVRLIEDWRGKGIALSVLGFGRGNLKDSKMEALADHGDGNYAYVDSLLEARKALVEEVGGTLATVAKDVKVQVEFNPAQVQAWRLLGYENRRLLAEDFADDAKDAGDMGAGHVVTAFYEVVPAGVPPPPGLRAAPALVYQEQRPSQNAAASGEWMTVRIRWQPPEGGTSRLLEAALVPAETAPSEDFQFASSVAEFGLLLRDSPYRGTASASQVLERARAAKGDDPAGYRSEFIQLVEAWQALRGRTASAREAS